MFQLSEGEVAAKKATQAYRAKKWDVCIDETSNALQIATHSSNLRQQHADCALAQGDIDQTVGDLTYVIRNHFSCHAKRSSRRRLTHLTAPSTSLFLRISSLAYYLLPPSSQALSTLKQCLHYDPDSKPCASSHRQLKKFDKTFSKLHDHLGASEWHAVIKLASQFSSTFDEALESALSAVALGLHNELPETVVPRKKSVRRREIYHAMCKAYIAIEIPRKAEPWCDEVLGMEGGDNDIDALKGKGEACLVKEEWEDATRYLERAFEASGRSDGDVRRRSFASALTKLRGRSTPDCKRHSGC